MPQAAPVRSDMKAAAFLLFALARSGRSHGREVSGADRAAIAVMIRRGMCHDNAAGSCATSASIASGERGALSANEPSGNEARIDAAHRFSAALLMLFGADDPASSAGLRYWPITHDLVLVHELCRHRQTRESEDERIVPGLAQDRIHMVMRQERGWLVIDSLKIDEACIRSACGRDADQRMDKVSADMQEAQSGSASSRWSQPLANRQSRCTVGTDMSSTSAHSSLVKPAK